MERDLLAAGEKDFPPDPSPLPISPQRSTFQKALRILAETLLAFRVHSKFDLATLFELDSDKARN